MVRGLIHRTATRRRPSEPRASGGRADATAGETASLAVGRRARWMYAARRIAILNDGRRIGRVSSWSPLELEVPAGCLQLRARLDWLRSEIVAVEAPPGGRVEVEVGLRGGLITQLWFQLATPRSALTLDARTVLSRRGTPGA